MECEKIALILIEDTETMQKAAEELSLALKNYKPHLCTGESFSGTDLLRANVFFLGCENSNPASFQYVDKILQHINLAGRSCGIFSTNNKALKYLSKLIEASGVKTANPLLIDNIDITAVSNNIKQWVCTIPPLSSF